MGRIFRLWLPFGAILGTLYLFLCLAGKGVRLKNRRELGGGFGLICLSFYLIVDGSSAKYKNVLILK
jgi:hypothetical protein